MKKFWIMAVAATVFAGCAKDTTEDVSILPQDGVLRVSIESVDSRVQLAGGETVWNEGDRVSVFYRTTGNERWKFTGATGDTEGVLERMNGEASDTPIDKICAIYPYATRNAVGTDGTFSFPLYVTRTYCKDSYGVGDNVMVASGDSGDLAFRNALGWIKVQLTGAETVKSIELSGNRNEPLAGTVTLNPDLTVSGIADAVSYLTLDCGDGVKLSETPTSFYFAVPPQTFEAGITITVSTASGEEKTEVTCNPISVSRNHIVPMSERGYDDLGKEVPANQIWYTSTDGKAVTPYYSDEFGANIVSNTYADGKGVILFDGPISKIGDLSFYRCDKLASITMPESITEIGHHAFFHCYGLRSVTIPNGVMVIGMCAFYNCTNLKSIILPNSVTLINQWAFEYCDKLTEIHISDLKAWCEIEHNASWISTKYDLYLNGEEITEIVIPNGITEIGSYVFSYCSSIMKVMIPNGVTAIKKGAFSNCNSLIRINLPDGIKSIESWAFADCSYLFDIIIPNGVTEIGDYAFSGCSNFSKVSIPDGVTKIGDCAFKNCANLRIITIPESVTLMGSGVLDDCDNLHEIHISDLAAWCNVEFGERGYISNGYILYLNGGIIDNMVIPEGLTSIKDYAFAYCYAIANVEIPNSVTSIGDYSFYMCSDITNVTVPDSITTIGNYAFSYCSGLTSITIPDSVTSIGDYAFYGCSGLTSITIPDSVTTIGSRAFEDCRGLTSITIPDSVTTIGSRAFRRCTSLASITIPDSVTEIGDYGFYKCSALADIYCMAEVPPTLGSKVFTGVPSEMKIYVPRASVEAYESAPYWKDYAIIGYDF